MRKRIWSLILAITLIATIGLTAVGCDDPTDPWAEPAYFSELYVYNGTAWVELDGTGSGGGGGASALNDLTDVTIAGLVDGHFLSYSAGPGQWLNRLLADGDIPAAIARDAEVTADIATHSALDTGVHGVGAGTVLGTGDVDDVAVDGATTDPISSNWAYDHNAAFEDHSARHEFGGADAADFTDWVKEDRAIIAHENGSTFDNANLWTQDVSAGATFTQALVGSYFTTDAVAGRTGYLYTVVNAFVYDWFHWIVLVPSGASNFRAWLWISNTVGASLPSSAQKCAGFRLEDGKIYAYSADGTAAEETEIAALNNINNSYMLKNNADSVQFYLNGVLEATHSTRYPGAVTQGVKMYLTNKANVAKSLYIRTIGIRRG